MYESDVRNVGGTDTNYLSLMANIGMIPYAEKGDVGNKKPEDLSKCKIVKQNDFVINSMNYQIGSYGVSKYDGVCSAVYIVLRHQPELVELRFALRIFETRSFQKYAQSFGNGILEHRRAISWDTLKGLRIAIPPLSEQRRLLNFLDRETAKIDALIDKQNHLIATLREDRTATITHTVTKGLNPDAEMKDTGVEWLGEVPRHWSVSRFSRHIAINGGQVDPRLTPYRDMPLIAPNHVESRTGVLIGLESAADQGADSGKYLVDSGQIVYSKIRPNLSKAVIAPCNCLCSADMYALSPDRLRFETAFVLRMLLSKPFTDYVVDSSMRVAMPKVNHDSLGAAPVWIPPLEEQRAIITHLDSECARVDTLIAKAAEVIKTLREYRSALITAAVTGKIDVRGAA
ncbi:restriction endonuclease subunit S [Rhodococcus sp. IEGM 1354]|nr:restriction endonuclease subunit S [Rhodococcus sp. IEGM 1354]MDI9932378.1 restriction endonuclease subunit S [Rhodococcus sp. IEGM 1354]